MKGRILPASVAGVFALIGVWMLLSGDEEVELLGWMSVLFFGFGGLVYFIPLLTRRGTTAVRITEIGGERGFLFPVSRLKMLVTVIAISSMATASALLILDGYTLWGIIGIAFFGGLALFGLPPLLRRRGLVLTPTRVIVLGRRGGEIPWEDVTGSYVDEDEMARHLSIHAHEADTLSLAADQLAAPPEVAVRAIAKYVNHPNRRAEIGTERELGYMRP